MSNQIVFFNSVADNWDVMCHHDKLKIKKILDLSPISLGDRIMDIGCGTGVLTPYLVGIVGDGGSIVGIDVSNRMNEVAKRKYDYDNVSFHCEDIMDFNRDGQLYSGAICFSVFPHFEDKVHTIKQIVSNIEVGGYIIIAHSQSRDEINNMHKKCDDAVNKDELPPMDMISSWFYQNNCGVNFLLDNDELFMIVGKKMK
ncbi:MAG: class I SAM-dependent methyltransferase [Erysipelotrichaceae bacterium]